MNYIDKSCTLNLATCGKRIIFIRVVETDFILNIQDIEYFGLYSTLHFLGLLAMHVNMIERRISHLINVYLH